MYDVACEPHPGVIVEGSGGVKRAHGLVDDRYASSCLPNIERQMRRVGLIGKRSGMNRLKNTRPPMGPDMAVKLAPAKFVHQFVINRQAITTEHITENLLQCDQSMGQIR